MEVPDYVLKKKITWPLSAVKLKLTPPVTCRLKFWTMSSSWHFSRHTFFLGKKRKILDYVLVLALSRHRLRAPKVINRDNFYFITISITFQIKP
jgi:hypothetical protein